MHPAMKTLLNSTTLPLWAAVPPLSKEWADIQQAWYAMVFAAQKMDEFLTTTYATEETIKSALKFLPHLILDEKLETANTFLIRECTRNIHLPLELTASIKHEAKKNTSKN